MPTVRELFDAMQSKFIPEKAVGFSAVYQFDISGEGGGKWYAAIEDGALSVVEGAHPSPNATISMTAQDYIDMGTGKLHGQVAFMTGKLKLKGDMALAIKMNTLFRQ